MTFSFIILNHNEIKSSIRCIKSILDNKGLPFEIIFVDNGSDEFKKSDLNRLSINKNRKIKIVRLDRNVGYAKGNNIASKKAKGRYLVFLNNDTVVAKDFILELNKYVLLNKPLIFQPKVRFFERRKFFDYAGGAGGYIDIFGYPFVRGRIFNTLEEDKGQYDLVEDIFWASGVCFVIKKSIFEKLGMFNNVFFAYGEETNLCFKAQRAGMRIKYCPNALVYHEGGRTSNKNIKLKLFLIHRNHLLLIAFNYSLPLMILILPLRLLLDYISYLYYLMKFRAFWIIGIIISAHVDFILLIPEIIKTRKNDKINNFGFPNRYLMYKGLLPYEYFFNKKRSFSEIFYKQRTSAKLMNIFDK